MIFMEKKKMVLMIFISIFTFILIIIIIGLVRLNLQNEEKVIKEDIKKKYELTKKEIATLTDIISIYDNYLIIYDGTKDINALTDLDKINFIDRLPFEAKKELDLDFNTGVSLNRIKNLLKKYFGPKTSFNPVNSTCFLGDGDYLIYDSNTKMYKANNMEHEHGAHLSLNIINYYLEGQRVVDNDKLIYTITLKKALAWPNTTIFYSNYKDLEASSNPVVDLYKINKEYEEDTIPDLLEPYKDKFTSYTYIFETKSSISNAYLKKFTKDFTNNEI